ncbi:restriction endonuclease subunit S [Moritella viscosa]|uniref:restriction endonuclease subunit S n=1 Tax=Moritella viscosa TaxID=80854 RepID=UPI000923C827|nr:restriction endonuclease subunit S [Moritella viscosa]SHO14529.1 Type I restriction-modification system [Moritella viscosa]SHO15627.1 Type I restriction-modification system [Moritella viscosa]SHO19068.1 Type I restriction-modification system [Moritella viscosa]
MNNLYSVKELISENLKGITPRYVAESNVVVLNQKCIRSNKINFKLSRYHDPQKKYSKEKIVRIGDILINSTGKGTAGRCAFVTELPEDKIVIVDSHILIVRVNDFNTAGCLEYSLNSIEPLLQTFVDGSTGQGEFDRERLFNVFTSLPIEDKRKDTLEFLLSIDQKIDLNNQICNELDAMVKTLFEYWFVQFDFPDSDGNPYKSSGGKMTYNKALKQNIPEGWMVDKLSKITSLIRRGISPKYVEIDGISVINQKCIRDHNILFEPCRRHGGVMKIDDERLLLPKDILINSTGVGTLGRVAFVKRTEEKLTTVDSHVTIVRADHSQIYKNYLAWEIIRLQPLIEGSAEGSTGQVELNKSYLENLDIMIPSRDLQANFKTFVEPIENEMANREIESKSLMHLRDWLLPMLMNGQVTVK